MILLVAASVVLVSIALGRAANRGLIVPGRRRSRVDVSAAIEQVAAEFRIPRWFAWAQADKESGLDPSAHHGDGEDSWGLYQINLHAHGETLAARGIGARELCDPMVNARYFGELAKDLYAEARRRGVSAGLHGWVAVRLRLKGIDWSDFGSDLARLTVARFRPYIAKWQERMGPG